MDLATRSNSGEVEQGCWWGKLELCCNWHCFAVEPFLKTGQIGWGLWCPHGNEAETGSLWPFFSDQPEQQWISTGSMSRPFFFFLILPSTVKVIQAQFWNSLQRSRQESQKPFFVFWPLHFILSSCSDDSVASELKDWQTSVCLFVFFFRCCSVWIRIHILCIFLSEA